MMNGNYQGGLTSTNPIKLTGSSLTDIHVSGSNKEILAGFCIVNEHTSALEVSVYWGDGSTDILFWRKSISAGDTVTENEIPLRLQDGYAIKAQCVTVDKIAVTPIVLRVG